MKILGITNKYSSNNILAPQALHKPSLLLYDKGLCIEILSFVPLTTPFLNIFNKRWKWYSELPQFQVLDKIKIHYPRYFEIPRNLIKSTAAKRLYNGVKNYLNSNNLDYKPDLIHSHMCYPDGYTAMKLANELKIPYIVTLRVADLYTYNNFKSVRPIMHEILTNADVLIAPTHRIASFFNKVFNINNISVVPNGIELDEFNNLPEIFLPSITEKKKIILSVSTLHKSKGIEINIKALSILLDKIKNVHYIIVGDGKEKAYLVGLVKELGLQKNVTFIGAVKHSVALSYIKQCDIFSLPAWNETFGLVYLEAMFLAKPIIGTINDGIDGVAINNEHGYMVEKGNVQQLSEAMYRLLLDDSLREKMGILGKNLVTKEYTWKNHIEQITEIYETVLSEKKI